MPTMTFTPVSFDVLPGWAFDDHRGAFQAWLATFPNFITALQSRAVFWTARALSDAAARVTTDCRSSTREFFEQSFRPFRVVGAHSEGLLTGYYEPVLRGSRVRTEVFQVPLFGRPLDLINRVDESQRGATNEPFTHMRRTAYGDQPFSTREEIERGALNGQGLELLYIADAVDAFFLHVQGSGHIILTDGTQLRVSYDGKNGHPYSSIGKYAIEHGFISASDMTLDVLATWLRADPVRARSVMWENKSFVFFRILDDAVVNAPLGVLGTPLLEGRSLAVDTSFHLLGLPIYVSAPDLIDAQTAQRFQRLMIAQDVGSAIRGPERGDVFFGSGPTAGRLAGGTNHACHFHVLWPHGLLPNVLQ
jgi:membrane-bound lytic murein transglycosylase A